MAKKQKYLGNRGMVVLLASISAFPPLSTDVYLPALPLMKEALNTTRAQINLTLSLFFVCYAAGMLFWGPISEKYGRKPILLTGLVMYVLSSIGCSLSQDIHQLIIGRVLQAFSAAAPAVIAASIAKDVYSGRDRERVMALVMSLVVVAPIMAPVIGAFLLEYVSWQALFLFLALFGIVTAVASCFLQETLEKRYTGSVFQSWGRLGVVLKNPHFSVLLVIFSTIPMTILMFLAVSSFIYINGFGMSQRNYSYFLAFNAAFSMLGPVFYMRLSRFFQPTQIITISFVFLALCGVLTITIGDISPLVFAVLAALATGAMFTIRVPGTNLMLEQQTHDTGSASALILFFGMLVGAFGVHVISLSTGDLIASLGYMQAGIGVFAGSLWFLLRNKSFVQYGFHKE